MFYLHLNTDELNIFFQFNIDELNGETLDISGKASVSVESNGRSYNIRKDKTALHSNVRTIVKNEINGSSGVGPAFSGTFQISEKFNIADVIASQRNVPLPVSCPQYKLQSNQQSLSSYLSKFKTDEMKNVFFFLHHKLSVCGCCLTGEGCIRECTATGFPAGAFSAYWQYLQC